MPLALNQICRVASSTLVDAAHDPLALGDLVLHPAGGAVVQIEVIPAVALGHPDDLAAGVLDVVAELAPAVVERLRLLRDDRARRAGRRVDFDDADGLVAALRVLEGDGPAVRAATSAATSRTGRGRGRSAIASCFAGATWKIGRLIEIDGIARLDVELLVQLRLHLVGRRRFDAIDDPAEAGADAIGGNLGRVRRPDDRLRVVGVASRPVAC